MSKSRHTHTHSAPHACLDKGLTGLVIVQEILTANSTQLNLKYCMRIYVKGIQLKAKLSNPATHVLFPPASCRG